VKKPKSDLTPAEKRVAKTLASLLWGDSSVKKTTKNTKKLKNNKKHKKTDIIGFES
jgi:hypothetical protein